jgi:preprotein translocase subunit YajC
MNPNVLLLAQAAGTPNMYSTVLMIGGLFAIMYFVMIRPQQKQMREHKEMLSQLKKGDDVVTQGGILGKIYAVMDKTVTVEIANGVRVRVLKTSVQGKGPQGDDAPAAKGDEKKDEKKEDK